MPTEAAATTAPAPKVVIEPTSKDAGNVTIDAASQDAIAYDISLKNASGVVMQNTGTTTFTFKVGKGLSGLKVYHNDDALDKVSTESGLRVGQFYYDSTNGVVKFVTDSYSPFTIVFDSPVALVNGVSYYNLQDALNVGGEVVILKDIDLGSSYVIIGSSKTVTLDLNGKVLKSSYPVIGNFGILTIKDKTAAGKIVSTSNHAIEVKDNSVTTIESGNIESVEGAIVTVLSTNATVNVKGGTLIASDNAVIAGNGSDRSGNPNTFNISGGTLNGSIKSPGYVACGIYSPWKDIVNFTGGTINAKNGAGIVARAGNVTVSGGTINTTGNNTGKVGDSRVVVPCSALVFDNEANYPAMTADSKISVSGGTFNSEAAAVTTVREVSRINITGGIFSSDPTNYLANGYDVNKENDRYVVYQGTIVCTAEKLQEILTAYTASGAGDNVVSIANDLRLADGETWTPARVQGYTGAGVITVNGNGHTIYGLNGPLFAGGFAGNSGIIVNDLTIDGAIIDDTNADQGLGAFICSIDSMPKIELNNCHLKNSTITSTGDVRVGGLIGWSAGYNVENDGPVKTYITITNCSVENCEITANGSVGAIIGHAGGNPATYHTITDCTVTGTTLNSTKNGEWRVGVVVGTANVGEVKISGTTESGNTLTQTGKTKPEHSNLYGRFVPGDTGKLTIDGSAIKN